eukprot:TRINITY_DN16695_c2_g1_i1.p1 TRINITY_DN16695_c2_g1~~TRINITY_DN16695_c2_g1_i1.p1  ORF type:complete len:189 (-),score=12.47 TRINITY_DN16695_c2_g1_i1:9-575(-)
MEREDRRPAQEYFARSDGLFNTRWGDIRSNIVNFIVSHFALQRSRGDACLSPCGPVALPGAVDPPEGYALHPATACVFGCGRKQSRVKPYSLRATVLLLLTTAIPSNVCPTMEFSLAPRCNHPIQVFHHCTLVQTQCRIAQSLDSISVCNQHRHRNHFGIVALLYQRFQGNHPAKSPESWWQSSISSI